MHFLPCFLDTFNTQVHEAKKHTPYELVFGQPLRSLLVPDTTFKRKINEEDLACNDSISGERDNDSKSGVPQRIPQRSNWQHSRNIKLYVKRRIWPTIKMLKEWSANTPRSTKLEKVPVCAYHALTGHQQTCSVYHVLLSRWLARHKLHVCIVFGVALESSHVRDLEPFTSGYNIPMDGWEEKPRISFRESVQKKAPWNAFTGNKCNCCPGTCDSRSSHYHRGED